MSGDGKENKYHHHHRLNVKWCRLIWITLCQRAPPESPLLEMRVARSDRCIVNETYDAEIETRPRRSKNASRPRRSRPRLQPCERLID